MLYLILAIVSSALVSLVMRLSEKYRTSGMGMIAANYVMCSVAALALAGWSPVPVVPAAFTFVLGGVSGVLYLLGFVLLQWNIQRNGVVLPATFGRLGVIVPTLAAMTIFGETPRWTQFVGIALAIAAILLMQGPAERTATGKTPRAGNTLGLIALLLSGGFCDVMSKVFDTWGPAGHSDHFLLYTFFTAMVLCFGLCLYKRERPTFKDLLWGLALGVPNYMSARFLLLCLGSVPAVVAYPTYSVGTIVLITAVSVLGFRERLDKWKTAALALVMVALALLNL